MVTPTLVTLIEEQTRRERYVLELTHSETANSRRTPDEAERNRALRLALRQALADPDFSCLLVDSIARLVEDDLKLHARLSKGLKQPRRGPRGTPLWQDILLVRASDEYRKTQKATFEDALFHLADIWGLAPDTMRSKLSRAGKRVPKKERRYENFLKVIENLKPKIEKAPVQLSLW